MSLVGKWTDMIYRVATGSWQSRLVLTPIVGGSYLGVIVIIVLLSHALDLWLSFPRIPSNPVSLIIGFCLIAFGLFLMVFSMVYFIKARGTPVPFNPPPKLVANGPYRFVRNPMLTGIFIQLFGIAVAMRSLSLAFIFTPFFIVMNVWELKNVEEPELERRLGKAYIDYKKRVPMFFPIRKRKQ